MEVGVGFIPLVRRWWGMLLAVTVLAGATAYVIASRLDATYEAETSVLVGPLSGSYDTLRASGDLARTYSELATSDPALRATAERVGAEAPIEELRKSVTATSNDVTRLVTIRVRNEDGELAARWAKALADALIEVAAAAPREQTEQIEELMRQREITRLREADHARVRAAVDRVLGTARISGRLAVVDPPEPPAEPIAPRVSLITLLAAAAGLLSAGVFVLLREYPMSSVETEEGLAEVAQAPVLGSIEALRPSIRRTGEPLVIAHRPRSDEADAYRLVATRIGLIDDATRIRSLVVVGTRQGEPTGVLAMNLAAALAEANLRVIVVDATVAAGKRPQDGRRRDRRRKAAAGSDGRPGYGSLLERAASGRLADEELDQLSVLKSRNLNVIPADTAANTRMIDATVANRLLERFLARSDLVIVNAPAVSTSPTALIWSSTADATAVIVSAGKTTRENVARTMDDLRRVRANVVGTILARDGRRLPLL